MFRISQETIMAEILVTFPYVIVRLACTMYSRTGGYRLARLADKYGAKIRMPDLLAHLAGDCKYWGHPGIPGCGAYFLDLTGAPRPPDLPPAVKRLRAVK
jgi:hypothetical protein